MSKKSATKASKKPIKDNTFNVYVYRILKNIHPDSGISTNAMSALSRISLFIVRQYATECSSLLISANKKVVDIPTICAATLIIFDGGGIVDALGPQAIKQIGVAIGKYENYKGTKADKKVRREFKAGLQMSVSRIKKIYKAANASNKSISDTSAVAIAASLEYLLSEIVELAGNASRDNKLTRITPRHLLLAIANDEELSNILLSKNLILGGGGVIPNIQAVLLPSISNSED